MLSSLKNAVSGLNVESLLKDVNFKEFQGKSIDAVRNSIVSIDDKTKNEVNAWFDTVNGIKTNSQLQNVDKEKQISELKTSDTVTNFLKAVMDVMLSNIPGEKQEVAKKGLTGFGMAAMAAVNASTGGLASMIIQKGLPKFILTSKFDEFANIIQGEIKKH